MSSILEIGNNKNKCQKFTPDALVDKMLEVANYDSDITGKTILENSFGNGQILKKIVVRYIECAMNSGWDKIAISNGLSRDIYGVELDKQLFDNCVAALNKIVEDFNLPKVEWNLYNEDALTVNFDVKFDYIIGNPPYISYKQMDGQSRKELKEKFDSCAIGKFDYCYAFIELGLKLLKDTGKLVQLIPNNIYKNVFAKKLRELLMDHISVIYDYPEQKLFNKTLTSVSIFLYDKNNNSENIYYNNVTQNTKRAISRQSLGEKWIFTAYSNTDNLTRFGDIFNASVTIATLYNKAFLVDNQCIENEAIEMDVLRKTASPKILKSSKSKYIIFPYKYHKQNLIRYSAKEFENLFPNAVKHLKLYSKELAARNSDNNIAWFEYGRTQALAHLNKEKLLVSSIITNKVEVCKINADTIPFSGIYITVKDNRFDLNNAIDILNSKQFMEYVRSVGINISGKSLRISSRDINNYMF